MTTPQRQEKNIVKPKTVLLTGGTGYIGSHTFVELVAAGFEVVIVDDFSNSKPLVIERLQRLTSMKEIAFYKGSVDDGRFLDTVFSNHKIDAVIHFAARKVIGESSQIPLDYIETNCSGLTTLLQAMRRAKVWTLVFSSSASVYGDPDIIPIPETAPLRYTHPYGFTKIVGEQILQQVEPTGPWCFGILRYFNPVGAHFSGLIGEDPSDVPSNLMPYLAKVAIGELPEVVIFGADYDTHDGTGIRDYIHVMDLARGHVLSLQSLLRIKKGHVLNFGTGNGHSVLEVIASYSAASGREIPYSIGPRRHGDIARCYADIQAAEKLLGFRTKYGLYEMCLSSWNWVNKSKGF